MNIINKFSSLRLKLHTNLQTVLVVPLNALFIPFGMFGGACCAENAWNQFPNLSRKHHKSALWIFVMGVYSGGRLGSYCSKELAKRISARIKK